MNGQMRQPQQPSHAQNRPLPLPGQQPQQYQPPPQQQPQQQQQQRPNGGGSSLHEQLQAALVQKGLQPGSEEFRTAYQGYMQSYQQKQQQQQQRAMQQQQPGNLPLPPPAGLSQNAPVQSGPPPPPRIPQQQQPLPLPGQQNMQRQQPQQQQQPQPSTNLPLPGRMGSGQPATMQPSNALQQQYGRPTANPSPSPTNLYPPQQQQQQRLPPSPSQTRMQQPTQHAPQQQRQGSLPLPNPSYSQQQQQQPQQYQPPAPRPAQQGYAAPQASYQQQQQQPPLTRPPSAISHVGHTSTPPQQMSPSQRATMQQVRPPTQMQQPAVNSLPLPIPSHAASNNPQQQSQQQQRPKVVSETEIQHIRTIFRHAQTHVANQQQKDRIAEAQQYMTTLKAGSSMSQLQKQIMSGGYNSLQHQVALRGLFDMQRTREEQKRAMIQQMQAKQMQQKQATATDSAEKHMSRSQSSDGNGSPRTAGKKGNSAVDDATRLFIQTNLTEEEVNQQAADAAKAAAASDLPIDISNANEIRLNVPEIEEPAVRVPRVVQKLRPDDQRLSEWMTKQYADQERQDRFDQEATGSKQLQAPPHWLFDIRTMVSKVRSNVSKESNCNISNVDVYDMIATSTQQYLCQIIETSISYARQRNDALKQYFESEVVDYPKARIQDFNTRAKQLSDQRKLQPSDVMQVDAPQLSAAEQAAAAIAAGNRAKDAAATGVTPTADKPAYTDPNAAFHAQQAALEGIGSTFEGFKKKRKLPGDTAPSTLNNLFGGGAPKRRNLLKEARQMTEHQATAVLAEQHQAQVERRQRQKVELTLLDVIAWMENNKAMRKSERLYRTYLKLALTSISKKLPNEAPQLPAAPYSSQVQPTRSPPAKSAITGQQQFRPTPQTPTSAYRPTANGHMQSSPSVQQTITPPAKGFNSMLQSPPQLPANV